MLLIDGYGGGGISSTSSSLYKQHMDRCRYEESSKMTTALTDYLTRLSDSIAQQKPSRLAKLFNQTSDPIQHVLRALHSETRGKVEKGYLANVIHRRGTALGLEEEWKTIVLERVWAGWMEENESWIEA